MSNEKYIVACIKEVKPSILVCDYSTWLNRQLNLKIKFLHTIDHKATEVSADLSGSIGLGTSDNLLEELVAVEHAQNKVLQDKARLVLEAVKRRSEKDGVLNSKICLRHGSLQENLLDLKEHSEIIVIGRYGPSYTKLGDLSVSAIVEQIIRSVERPILVISKPYEPPQSALFAYDNSLNSQKALEYILNTNILKGLKIHLVYVGEKSDASLIFISEAKQKLKNASFAVDDVFLSGETDQALIDYINTNNISLMAMGAFGKHWIKGLLMGSFTTKILNLTDKPLFLFR